MLVHGVQSYVRPGQIELALELLSGGGCPLAGGTHLLAQNRELGNVVDLSALGLASIDSRGGDLHLGAMVSLQQVIDSEPCYLATGGLLPAACRAHSASRALRGMATLGGEAIHASPDSEVVAALLALNAIFVVRRADGLVEIPALRFLRNPADDLRDGGLATEIILPGRPGGAALERVGVLPSAPPLLAVAAAVQLAGDCCTRARVALTGLTTPPARVLEGESRLEGSDCSRPAVAEYVEHALERAPFRDDVHASAGYRRSVARILISRALSKAMERARSGAAIAVPRLRSPERASVAEAPRLESGDIEVRLNGAVRRARARAGDSLLAWLRAQGAWSVKHGCESGECGACTVLLDAQPVSACLTLAARAHSREVQTVESLGSAEALHPIQAAFVETGAIQCGYCTPAMELSAKALLDVIPDPTEQEIRDALAGCLCRCTGYVKPVEAVTRAAKAQANAKKAELRNRAFPAPKSR